ncbi:F-box domain-containing protein [Favolaschia claudopus]|uniref:F-box domain-containing protein n=1 Tax=Favolaschia claudopus TaxID=2862362 RepID=A0AAW0CV62_9AGAR
MPGPFDLAEMNRRLSALQHLPNPYPINLDSPPDEVLRRIFRYIQADSASSSSPQSQFVIASVTRRWREVAIKIPSLWTTIRISHDRQMAVLRDIVHRSLNQPLKIYIRLEAFRYRFFTEYLEAVDILIPHVAQWHTFSVTATNPVLHLISKRLHLLPMPMLERFELVQCDSGHIQHFGPFVFSPAAFRFLRLERTMMYAEDAPQLKGLEYIELKESSLAMLDEHKLLSIDYPSLESRTPSMGALRCLILDGSNPVTDRGLPYSPAFVPVHITTLSFARLTAPSMDRVQALSRFFGTALSAPALRSLAIEDIHGYALTMLLSVIRAQAGKKTVTRFPTLERLALVGIETTGIDDKFMSAFNGGMEELVLARLDAEPILKRLGVQRELWPALRRIELDGEVVSREGAAQYGGEC